VHPADGVDELVLAERVRQRLDLVPVLGQPRRRIRMDVLNQQRSRGVQRPYLSPMRRPGAEFSRFARLPRARQR
jgi:hypothetical protein